MYMIKKYSGYRGRLNEQMYIKYTKMQYIYIYIYIYIYQNVVKRSEFVQTREQRCNKTKIVLLLLWIDKVQISTVG